VFVWQVKVVVVTDLVSTPVLEEMFVLVAVVGVDVETVKVSV
jgi:hypothetical protein